jgi:hypothetical protein
VALVEGCESHVRHLLDAIIDVNAYNGSSLRCCRVEWDLHLNLTRTQAVSVKRVTAVGWDQPILTELDERAQELSWKPRLVSARGLEEAVLAKSAVGVVIQTHLKIRHEANNNRKKVKTELFPKDYVPELNTKMLGNSSSYLTTTHTPLFTKRFRNYGIWTIDIRAEFCFWIE